MPTNKTPAGFRNVSYPGTEQYQTEDGNVTIQRVSARSWVVMPRGRDSFYVTSRDRAIERARELAALAEGAEIPGFYYVSALDGARSARIRGPFTTHGEALAQVDAARRALVDLMPHAHFYSFGTCRSDQDLGPGYLDTLDVPAPALAPRWRCLTCTREGAGAPPTHCPGCTSEHDANHGPHVTQGA